MFNFIIGMMLGFALALLLTSGVIQGSKKQCMRENPGYDCDIGWIKGDPL